MTKRVTGVDGCSGGWVAIDLGEGGGLAALRTATSLDDLLADTADAQVVGIDMPLGLLAGGWRTADREARALLGPRRSSIFAIPHRSGSREYRRCAISYLREILRLYGGALSVTGLTHMHREHPR